jgi:FkbM family methyltransferase
MITLKTTIQFLVAALPVRLKNSLLHLSFNAARAEFDRFSYLYAHAPNMEMGLSSLARRGLQPVQVIDVGAFEGDWSRMARRIWPDSKFILIEPNAAKSLLLTNLARTMNAILFRELLGANDGTHVIFNVMESGSSVLSERSPLARTQEKRTLSRMDTVIQDLDGSTFLKIDAQGYELEILRGAEKLIHKIDAILLEVSIIEINEGAPLIADVIAFMKSIGFVMCEILEIHRRPLDQALNQVDVLFVREDSVLQADKRHFA